MTNEIHSLLGDELAAIWLFIGVALSSSKQKGMAWLAYASALLWLCIWIFAKL